MHYFGSGLTDIGIKKSINQDSICLMISDTNNMGQVVLAVVCDGIGGLEQGELASSATTKRFAEWYKNSLPKIISSLSDELLQSEWKSIINDMNYKLVQYGKSRGIRVGTTLTAFLIINDRYMIAQVGDSRAYCFENGIKQITEDHTYLNREIKSGRADINSLRRDPRRNRITESIGATENVHPDFYFGKIESQDQVWMLCSDGLRHKITSKEFEEKVIPEKIADRHDLEDVASNLIDTVTERGEKDNISVILIKADKIS